MSIGGDKLCAITGPVMAKPNTAARVAFVIEVKDLRDKRYASHTDISLSVTSLT